MYINYQWVSQSVNRGNQNGELIQIFRVKHLSLNLNRIKLLNSLFISHKQIFGIVNLLIPKFMNIKPFTFRNNVFSKPYHVHVHV